MTYVFPTDFSDDVLSLIAIGEANIHVAEWIDYTTFLAEEHIPELIRIVNDIEIFMPDDEQVYEDNLPETYAPIHAWRALGQLKAEEAIPALLKLIVQNEDSNLDWVMEEIPEVMALIGSACIPPLGEYLLRSDRLEWASITVAHALADIGVAHPENRAGCVSALETALENYAENLKSVNGFIVSFLMDLKAVESDPVVKRAFDADAVDLTIMGDYEEYQLGVGLIEERKTPARDFLKGRNEEISQAIDELREYVEATERANELYNMIDPNLKKAFLS